MLNQSPGSRMARFCFPAILQQTLGKSPKLLPSVPFSSVTMLTLSLQSALRPVNTVRDKTTTILLETGIGVRCREACS